MADTKKDQKAEEKPEARSTNWADMDNEDGDGNEEVLKKEEVKKAPVVQKPKPKPDPRDKTAKGDYIVKTINIKDKVIDMNTEKVTYN